MIGDANIMENKFLDDYYSNYDEEGRLLCRHGSVEFLTTTRYNHELYIGRKQ